MFNNIKQLKVGKVIEVTGASIVVELDEDLTELSKSYQGKVYSIGLISSIIKIIFGRKILFASVKSLKLRSELELLEKELSVGDDKRVLEANLIGEGVWLESKRHLKFTRGIEQYPLPLQSAYIMTEEEMIYFYRGAEFDNNEGYDPSFEIGTYGNTNQVCKLNGDNFLGQHSAVLGNTGSGKSATVSAIIHGILSEEKVRHPRIVIIDPHGEYSTAFSGKGTTYETGTENKNTKHLKLPYWIMNSEELVSLFIGKTEREATSQNNIIYRALSYARMVEAGILNPIEENPNGEQIPELREGKTEQDILSFDRDKPRPFKLSDFVFHIDKIQGRKKNETNPLAPTKRESHDSILRKIDVLRANPQLKFVLDEYDKEQEITLSKVLVQLLGAKESNCDVGDDDVCNLKIINTSGLPNEVAGILIALISRLIFQYKIRQSREEREREPVLLVYEEAHQYVPNKGEAQYKEAQDAIRRIAKEGRKYGIGLMIVSQRPADLESTVLSQCSSWVVLRLTNEVDHRHVSNFIPDNLSGLLQLLPALTRREAIVVGEAIALPSRVKIRKLSESQIPDSNDIKFIKGWEEPYNTVEEIEEIVGKWLN